MEDFKKQVEKSAYSFERYCGIDRWSSYHYQLRDIVQTRSSSILEVGVGDRVVANYLKHNTDIEYTSIDIADDVGADVMGSITKLPFENKSFDSVCAFEVLEHLPYDTLDTSLSELARVARRVVDRRPLGRGREGRLARTSRPRDGTDQLPGGDRLPPSLNVLIQHLTNLLRQQFRQLRI